MYEHRARLLQRTGCGARRAAVTVGFSTVDRRAPRRTSGDTLSVLGLPARQRFTFDEYLLLEEIAEVKHEFLDGEVWAMAGGSPEHASIIGNVTTLLNVQLRGQRCRVHTIELRARVKATGLGVVAEHRPRRSRPETPDDLRVGTRPNEDADDSGGR